MRIGAGKAPWQYFSADGVGSGVRELTHSWRQGDAGGAQGETGGGPSTRLGMRTRPLGDFKSPRPH